MAVGDEENDAAHFMKLVFFNSTVFVALVLLLVTLPLSRCCTGDGQLLFCAYIPPGKIQIIGPLADF